MGAAKHVISHPPPTTVVSESISPHREQSPSSFCVNSEMRPTLDYEETSKSEEEFSEKGGRDTSVNKLKHRYLIGQIM